MTRQSAFERFELAAPEQHKSFASFAKACIPSVREAWEKAKEDGRFTRFNSAKQYFDWCWAQPEAEHIFKAFHDLSQKNEQTS